LGLVHIVLATAHQQRAFKL